jgi:hypothetical protein
MAQAHHPANRTLASILFDYGLRCRAVPSEAQPNGMHRTALLTKQNLADLFGVSRVAVLGWVKAGKITPARHDEENGWPLFDLDDVLAIARNAIREGLAPALLANPLPGPAPTKIPPR